MAAYTAASRVSHAGNFTGLNAGLGISNTSLSNLSYVSQASSSKSSTRRSGRFGFRAGAKRALISVKTGLRTALRRAVVCGSSAATGAKTPVARKASAKRSASIRSRLSARSRRLAKTARSGTPTICLTHPTMNGKNARLSLHEGPVSQDGGSADSGKSTRFSHPAVSAMVPQSDLTPMTSPAAPSFVSVGSGASWETVGSEVSLEDGRSVDANKVFASVKLSDVQSCYNAREYLDGLKGRPVSGTAPALPYIAYSPAAASPKDFAASHDVQRAAIAAKVQADFVAAGAAQAPVVVFVDHPGALMPGQAQAASGGLKSETLSAPRTTAARPHTTGELPSVAPGTSFLPYIAYNPSFNPYNSSKASLPAEGKAPSNASRGAAFAEAEASEQAVHNARHSAHYSRIESGVVHSPVVVSFAESSAPAAPTAPSQSQIRRKPVASASKPAAQSSASKPLPAVPTAMPMVDNGFPVLDASAARSYRAMPDYSRRSTNAVEAMHRKEEAAKAAKKAKKSKKAADAKRAAAVEAGVANLML